MSKTYNVKQMTPREYVKFYNTNDIAVESKALQGATVKRNFSFQPIQRTITLSIKNAILGEKPDINIKEKPVEYDLRQLAESFESVLAYGEVLAISGSSTVLGNKVFAPSRYSDVKLDNDEKVISFTYENKSETLKYKRISTDATGDKWQISDQNTRKTVTTYMTVSLVKTHDGLPCYSSADRLIYEYNDVWVAQRVHMEAATPRTYIPRGYLTTNKAETGREAAAGKQQAERLNTYAFDNEATHLRMLEGSSDKVITSDFKYDTQAYDSTKMDLLRQISSSVQVDLAILLKGIDGGFKTATEVITNRHALYQTVELYKPVFVELARALFGHDSVVNGERVIVDVTIYDSIKDDQTEYNKALQADVAAGIIDQVQYVMERYSKTENEARLMVTGSEKKDETTDLRNRMDIVNNLGDNISIEQRVAILYPSMGDTERLREVVLIKVEQGMLLTTTETQYALQNGLLTGI